PVAVGGRRQRALLTLLAVRPGRVVSADELSAALWEAEPPGNAANALQAVVSRLRRDPGEACVVTQPPGYVLQVRGDDVDAGRFERLADEGRRLLALGDPEGAERTLLAALELWRGPALEELAGLAFAAQEAGRLEDRRLGALEDRVDAAV